MNNFLLQNPSNATFVSQKLEEFFTTNVGSVAEPAVLWNAHKSFIQGFFIQLGSTHKKKRLQKLHDLTAAIAGADLKNKSHPSLALQSQIFKLRHEL